VSLEESYKYLGQLHVRMLLHREAEKSEPVFIFVCIFFNTRQKLVNFFAYIKESISYNSVYSILACVKNFA